MNIALKEADETEYWLRLLRASDIIKDDEYNSLVTDARQLIGTLVKIIKNSKQ
jgi:four helix bundle protein